MELLFELRVYNQSEEPCEENIPNKEIEENFDIPDYDYNKRLWF
ncbi:MULTISPECIES: hypothetical protein [Bacillaceae]|uniref:Uncharacterized protein n=1 Tax=Bacillus salipaludis TaxID=2547811 RepID=A0AA90TNK6_9BACI|nr:MULTISPECIES: hypothetical protein [Bacillaceae]MDQ6595846.1 hypothetical protein [Bacillus salipaludis]WHY92532.1 hypothetical protein QNK12_03200 [Neobacillus cucumis]